MRVVDIRLYRILRNMKSRCYNKNFPRYKNYGGRGIKVCEDWKKDFKSFYDWAINNGYNDNLTIDRIDNDGNYCPENCRWITKSENSRRTQTSKIDLLTAQKIRERTKERITDLAREYNCSISTIWSIRNNHHHLPEENARSKVLLKYKTMRGV